MFAGHRKAERSFIAVGTDPVELARVTSTPSRHSLILGSLRHSISRHRPVTGSSGWPSFPEPRDPSSTLWNTGSPGRSPTRFTHRKERLWIKLPPPLKDPRPYLGRRPHPSPPPRAGEGVGSIRSTG